MELLVKIQHYTFLVILKIIGLRIQRPKNQSKSLENMTQKLSEKLNFFQDVKLFRKWSFRVQLPLRTSGSELGSHNSENRKSNVPDMKTY